MSDIQEEIEYEQHCNEQLRNKITNLEYKIERLEEENKQLKDLCDKYEEEHNNEFQCWKRDRKELLDKRNIINKAIEYIERDVIKNVTSEIILEILKGDNK